MRIVALSDTHTFEREMKHRIPDGDVLIHAGDLLRAGTLEELEPVAAWLRELPHPHKIVVAGNHDVCFQTDADAALASLGAEIHYLEDSGLELGGVSFWGSPWTPLFHDWAFMLPRGQELAQKWRLIPVGVDVLITHGPAHGIGDGNSHWGHIGCEELRSELQRIQPAAHLFGHVHAAGGVYLHQGICAINVTTWECERPPTVFDIDPDTQRIKIVHSPLGELYS